jgi:Second Messenger Oligonucleotide or Dinucleotide Synthetase domain
MAVAPAVSFTQDFTSGLDGLLCLVCEELQLTSARHDQAVERYETLGDLLESEESPFHRLRPTIYPQGSMALGTTVKPIEGPHDLDFVLELSLAHHQVDPMRLIDSLYRFLLAHGVYGPMTSLKNRCVRIEYTNDFYMDILPACRNGAGTGTCIKVPDRALRGWSDSDPKGYNAWFERQSRAIFIDRVLDKAEPVPAQEAVREKRELQLVVQLLKRWRDVHYAHVDATLAPISIVLTTLAGDTYRGERSVSRALAATLSGILGLVNAARSRGERLTVWNPSPNVVEDLSERWSGNAAACRAFENGIRDFHCRWSQLVARGGDVSAGLDALFGEPVKTALRKQAKRLQEDRMSGKLGVTSAGLITSATDASVRMVPNTFHGSE